MELINFDKLSAALAEFADFAAEQYKANLIRDGRPASGELMNTITTSIRQGEKEWVVSLNLQDYWKYIEYGTKGRKTGNPGRKFPPVNKILQWVQIKPGLPKPATLPEQQDLARRIAGKIYWYGTKGKPSLEDAKQFAIAKYRQQISEALGHDMIDYIRKIVRD